MTRFHNSFEGGTNAAQITPANSGGLSGNAFDYVFYNNTSYPGGNANIIYSTAAALAGSMGARIALGTSATYLAWFDLVGGGNRAVARFPIKFAANPTASAALVELRSASSSMAGAKIRTTGKVQAYNRVGTALTGSDYQLSTGTLYWGELAATKGTGTTDGRIEMKIYAADGTTQLFSWDSGAAVDAGTAIAESVRFPANTSASGWKTQDLDELQFDSNLSSGFLGPWVGGNELPAVDLVTNKSTLFPGETATLTLTASDIDGTIVSTVWATTIGTLVVVDSTHQTLTAPASLLDQTATVSVTCTDDDGGERTDTVDIILKASAWRLAGGTPLVERLIT